MAGWFDHKLSAIREYPFDFEKYIETRLRDIDDLDERRFAKEVLLNGLGKIISCMEEKYQRLEQRVFEEVEIAANQYEVVMTVVHKEHYDPANETLYPVCMSDFDFEALTETMSGESHIFLGTVFFQADDRCQKEFEGKGQFDGVLENQVVRISACQAERYQSMMEMLYQVFQDNHIPWQTINTGYLDKFYDIYLEGDIARQAADKLSLKDVAIQYGEFERFIRYDMIPLWNMEWISFNSAVFMLPCMDGIYYEHEFSLGDKEEKDGYLIKSNEDILEIRHEKKKIVIKSLTEIFEEWRALHMIQRPTDRSLDYNEPLLTNHKRDSFIRRYYENSAVQLMTKTDLFRRIMEYNIREFVEVVGYEICSEVGNYPDARGMNWFIRDELFPMESRKVLLLKFENKQPGHYLSESMVRFVISQIQMEIGEYRCVGVII